MSMCVCASKFFLLSDFFFLGGGGVSVHVILVDLHMCVFRFCLFVLDSVTSNYLHLYNCYERINFN